MEDAAEKLDELARAEKQCTKCDDIVSCRLRALSGAGHPHAQVMFVSLHPSPEEEAADLPAGTGVGSSSSFTVGLLNALYAYQGKHKSAEELAQQHPVALGVFCLSIRQGKTTAGRGSSPSPVSVSLPLSHSVPEHGPPANFGGLFRCVPSLLGQLCRVRILPE